MRYTRSSAKRKILTLRTAVIALIILVVGGYAITTLVDRASAPDERTALAQCLTEKGVTMYGAYWCPHCARQKQAFGGKAWKEVDYVECAVPGNRAEQTEACKKQNITGYPTWIFADESRMSGEVELSVLAEKAGCAYGDVVAADTGSEGTTDDSAAGGTVPASEAEGVDGPEAAAQ